MKSKSLWYIFCRFRATSNFCSLNYFEQCTFTEPIRKKSNRGYENRNRTEPWKSWTVPALLYIQKIAILLALEFVDWTLHKNHKNLYPTKIKPSTIQIYLQFDKMNKEEQGSWLVLYKTYDTLDIPMCSAADYCLLPFYQTSVKIIADIKIHWQHLLYCQYLLFKFDRSCNQNTAHQCVIY